MKDPWGFNIEVPDDGQRIRYRRKKYRDGAFLGWEEGVGTVHYVWCGVEPVVTLTDGSFVMVSLDDTWAPIV